MSLAVDLDRVRIAQSRMTTDQPGAGVRQQLAVDAIDTRDLAILVVTQGRPVEAGRANRPAVTLCVREVVRVRRAVDAHLFRSDELRVGKECGIRVESGGRGAIKK